MIITKIPKGKSLGIGTSILAQYFSSDTINWRVPAVDPYTNKITDQFVHLYNNLMFSAYLQKRKLKRSQIWPKIHIIDPIPQAEQKHIKYQKLFEIKKLLDDDLIQKIIKEDPTQISSLFIISVFSEDHFKELLDQYVSKVLVCGKASTVQNEKQMNEIKEKVINLYRIFYFGEKLTPLQRQIQLNYLAAKQDKFIRKQSFKKDSHLNCTWRHQDQRLLQDLINWPQADINLSDLSYRPFYEPLDIAARLPYAQKFYLMIGGDTFLARWTFDRNIKKQYEYSTSYLNWLKQKIFTRTIQYTKCLQFTHNMKIPPDFMIELCILNIHIWMMTDRLKQFNTNKSKKLAFAIDEMFKEYVNNLLGSLNIKKLSITKRNFQQILAIAKNTLNMHFYGYKETKANPYLDIDALIWSIAFRQKVQRYSDQVYLFSEYLIKNWQQMKNYTQEDFIDAVCEFDCYLVDPDYKQKITAINPPLPQEEFQQQFASNKVNKKYYYRAKEQGRSISIEFRQVPKNSSESLQYSLIGSIVDKIAGFIKKYISTLDKYDHFNEMEKQKKHAEASEKLSPWEGSKERITKVDEQFVNVEEIRKSRSRNMSRGNIMIGEDPQKKAGSKATKQNKD